ncbi:MAG: hypothetical protein ACRDMH_01140 [Solirubrobacterales bacterium]
MTRIAKLGLVLVTIVAAAALVAGYLAIRDTTTVVHSIDCDLDNPPADCASESDPYQIRQVVDRFNAAASGPDAEILCGEVLPPSSLHVPVDDCTQKLGPVMEQNPGDWRRITDISRIKVHGDRANATVAKAAGQPFEATFVREDGHWYMQVFD